MNHSCEIFANGVIETLAALEAAGKAEVDGRIVPGLHPTWDEEEGAVALSYRAEPGTLLQLEAQVSGAPRWLTLNIDLGPGAFEAGDVIGIVADIAGEAEDMLGMFIRSTTQGGDVDTELAEPLFVAAQQRVAAALHVVAPQDGVAGSERFHMLGLKLPKRDFRLEIRGLRVFVRPAAEVPEAPAMTLAGTAG